MMYNESLNIILKANSDKGSMALLILEQYVNGTILQWNRIQVDRNVILDIYKQGLCVNRIKILTLFLDIHFYFICYDKSQNLIKKFIKYDDDPTLESLWQTLEPKFKLFNDARNHLEHIDDRIKSRYLLE